MKLSVIERNGERVLTTNQLAESYGTDSKSISKNFERNRERFQEGKHFLALTGDELKEFKGYRQNDDSLKYVSVIYLWTKKGAFMVAKSLNSDLAWNAYEKLVDGYYDMQNHVKALSEREQLVAAMKVSIETAAELDQVKTKVMELANKVDEQITLDHGEQRRIQRAVGAKVYEISSHQDENKSLFSELYREIKDRFGIGSYRDLKRKDMLKALNYIEAWIPKKRVG